VPGSGIRFAGEPIVVDLDGDGNAEVIFTSWPQKGNNRVGQLHILDSLGNLLHAVDLPAPAIGANWNGGLAAPTIANIDGDPDLELVIGTSHSGAVAYDLPGSENARILWGTGRGTFHRTGVAPEQAEALSLAVNPAVQRIEAAGSAVYTLSLNGVYSGTVSLSADVPGDLIENWSDTTVTLPAEVTLTLTDTHSPGPLMPGLWYEIEVSAGGGGNIQMVIIRLLVGGSQGYLPGVFEGG
jgi:hypothetical protein